MAALPVMKMATLAVKQMAKPVAKIFSEGAKRNYVFRAMCGAFAETYHKADVTFKRLLRSGDISADIKPLNVDIAVQRGADMLSELTILGVGVAVLLYEWHHSSEKDAKKKKELEDRLVAMEARLDAIEKARREESRRWWHGKDNAAADNVRDEIAKAKADLSGSSNGRPPEQEGSNHTPEAPLLTPDQPKVVEGLGGLAWVQREVGNELRRQASLFRIGVRVEDGADHSEPAPVCADAVNEVQLPLSPAAPGASTTTSSSVPTPRPVAAASARPMPGTPNTPSATVTQPARTWWMFLTFQRPPPTSS